MKSLATFLLPGQPLLLKTVDFMDIHKTFQFILAADIKDSHFLTCCQSQRVLINQTPGEEIQQREG